MKTNLVLQSFGRENEYKRAVLTIISYYAYTSLPLDKTRVILFTDKPKYFHSFLSGLPIDYILLTPEKIKVMQGKIEFLHRMKIALIEEAFSMTEGNMLYADSDTFFISDPTPLVNQVVPEKSFMHLWEHDFESLRNMELPAGKTFQAFVKLIESQKFKLADGKEIILTTKHSSWNAGVMMFHPSHVRFIPDVYTLTEQFYPLTQNHASEQYAFSIILQNNTVLLPCDSVIYHYWYRTKKQIIDLFLAERITRNLEIQPLEQKLLNVKKWTEMLPAYFEDHILMLKDQAIQSFNERKYKQGYKFTVKVLGKELIKDRQFIQDVLFHTKSCLLQKWN